MKILAMYPHMKTGESKTPKDKRYFPWGFATVLKLLEEDGHTITLIDAYGEDLIRSEVEERLASVGPCDAICLSGYASMNYTYIKWLSGALRKRYRCPIILGGVLADHHYRLLLEKRIADICVLGEGEVTAPRLLRSLDKPDTVPGIAFYAGGQVRQTAAQTQYCDLDTLPMPNFALWKMERYTSGDNLWIDDKTTRVEGYDRDTYGDLDRFKPNMSIFAGRGCPYQCTFCSKSTNKFRVKSIPRITKEMKLLKETFGIKAFHFYDELLVFNKKRTEEFCAEVKRLGVYWDCQARINTVNDEMLALLKDANCLSLGFGIESGSNEILAAMNKRVTREQSLRVLGSVRRLGLHAKLQFMFGYPGENRKSLQQTVQLVKQIGLPPRRMLWCTPLPGSPLYDDVVKRGLIPDEEQFVLSLAGGMNYPGHLILNLMGDDTEAVRLYWWTHFLFEKNYLVSLLFTREKGSFQSIRYSFNHALFLLDKYLLCVSALYRGGKKVKHYAGKSFSVAFKLIFGPRRQTWQWLRKKIRSKRN